MFEHQPMVVYLSVSECICVSVYVLPYCSAHDEWLIMKLLQVLDWLPVLRSTSKPIQN